MLLILATDNCLCKSELFVEGGLHVFKRLVKLAQVVMHIAVIGSSFFFLQSFLFFSEFGERLLRHHLLHKLWAPSAVILRWDVEHLQSDFSPASSFIDIEVEDF